MTAAARPRRRARGRDRGRCPAARCASACTPGSNPVTKQRHYLPRSCRPGRRRPRRPRRCAPGCCRRWTSSASPRPTRPSTSSWTATSRSLKIEDTTRAGYERLIRCHIRPLLGAAAGRPDRRRDGRRLLREPAALPGALRRPPFVEHRPLDGADHECDRPVRTAPCRPLGDGLDPADPHCPQRRVHPRGPVALDRGQPDRRRPSRRAAPDADPHPPTAEQAATHRSARRGATGLGHARLAGDDDRRAARRTVRAALGPDRLRPRGVLDIRASIAQGGSRTWEKDTKTHQQRRIALDARPRSPCCAPTASTATRWQPRSASSSRDAGSSVLPVAGRVDVARSRPRSRQRYARMCARLGWDMHIHQLRHYSATELIAAGVDVRTVAGRLGHGGGGATTLRVYSAWVAEADQRAAGALTARLPELPGGIRGRRAASSGQGRDSGSRPVPAHRQRPAGSDSLRALRDGDPLPPEKELATRYGVSASTAHRAVSLLIDVGEVVASRGRRARVAPVRT